MSVRVYEYGLLPPTVNADLVDQQMRDAHRYRNMLTEIERARRTRVREIMSSHQDMAPLQQQIDELTAKRNELRDGVKKTRAATRSRSETKEQRDAIKALNEQIKNLVIKIKEIREAVRKDPEVQNALGIAEADARQRVRDERAKCGVYWGTYLLQEADADRARQESSMPKFEPWRGNGRVSVQLQGGLELSGLWGSDTQIQIAPVSPDAYDRRVPKGARRRAGRTVLRLRVSSMKGRPVWAEFPMIMHRPLPEGAVIKVATVQRRKRDCVSWYWRLQMTVDTTACISARPPAPDHGAVALNLGFAVRPGGTIRAGFLVGTDGLAKEILTVKSDIYRGAELSPDQLAKAMSWISNGLKKSEDIRSIRDNNLNMMKASFAPWCANVGSLEQPAAAGLMQDQPRGAADRTTLAIISQDQPAAEAGPDDHRTQDQPGGPGHSGTGYTGLTGLAVPRQDQPAVAGQAFDLDPAGQADEFGRADVASEQPAVAGPRSPAKPGDPGLSLRGCDWFREETKSIGHWLSAARFRALSLRWETNRFPGDEAGFELLLAWRERDEHLERYEAGIRGSAIRDRLEAYRVVAAQMAKRYLTLVIDGTDLSKYQDAGPVENEKRDSDIVRRNQRIAAGSLLRGALMNAFGPERTVKMPAGKRTSTCHKCQTVNEWDRASSDRMHTCSCCGARWDIDENFCRNLLGDWAAGADAEDTAPKKPSRSERLRIAATSKKVRPQLRRENSPAHGTQE